jgi:hypothetical protein
MKRGHHDVIEGLDLKIRKLEREKQELIEQCNVLTEENKRLTNIINEYNDTRNDGIIGKSITRSEAIKISHDILKKAEKERIDSIS